MALSLLLWAQAALAGLTARELRLWREADPLDRDSLLRAWGYWQAESTHAGPRYRLRELTWKGDSAAIQPLRHYPWRRWIGSPLTPALLEQLPREIQQKLNQAGYLYSSVAWQSLTCSAAGACQGQLHIQAGPLVRIDTILLRGKWPAPRSAFYQITGLRLRQPLNTARWEALPQRLRTNPYATLVDTPKLWLFPNLCWIELTVRPKNANRIDGALSVLPSTTNAGSARPQVIGHLDLALVSPLRLGERIEARYAQLPGGSQRLNLLGGFPYLLRGLVELRGQFTLWRQDTSFLTRSTALELRYRLTGTLTLKGRLLSEQSRLLSTQPYRDRIWPPPPVLDFRRRGLSLGWEYDNTDLRTAPRTGWRADLQATQGNRAYLRNPALPLLAYERLPATGSYQELTAHLERYFTLNRLLVLRLGGRAYGYWSAGFAENELARFGGESYLRGFPENTLPASTLLQALVEPRLVIEEEEGFLGAFGEVGQLNLFPSGPRQAYSAGVVLQTRLTAGLLRLTFAAGRLQGTPWDLRRALVGIAWISEF